MATVVKTYAYALPTSDNSSWSCTVPSWTDVPTCAIITWVKNNGNLASTESTGKLGYGFCATDQAGTPTITQGCWGGISEHASAKQDCSQYLSTTRCLWAYGSDTTGNIDTETYCSTLEATSFGTGGITFNYRHGSSANCGGEYIVITFISCDNAYVGTRTFWSNGTFADNSAGFQPTGMVWLCSGASCAHNSSSVNWDLTLSLCGSTSGKGGNAIAHVSDDADNAGAIAQQLVQVSSSWYGYIPVGDGANETVGSGAYIPSYTTLGFNYTCYATINPAYSIYLAFDTGDEEVKGYLSTFPANTSSETQEPDSSLGFTPQYVHVVAPFVTGVNTIWTSDNGADGAIFGAIGIGHADGTREYSGCVSEYDASGDTYVWSQTQNDMFVLTEGDGTGAYRLGFSEFNADGWKWTPNATTKATTRYYAYLAIEASSDTTDDLTAVDTASASAVTIPSLGQKHNLSATDTASASDPTDPDLGQAHVLAATDVASDSDLTDPELSEIVDLTALDSESASAVTVPAIGQVHNLSATDTASESDVTDPALGQTHVITALDVESDSDLTDPALGQAHALAAGDVESDSDLTDPAIGESNVLTALDSESASAVTVPAIGQVHNLSSVDTASESDLTDPALAQVHALAALDVESDSDLTDPALGQAHALAAGDVESDSDLTDPEVTEANALSAEDVESGSEVTAPAIGQVHNLSSADTESASDLTDPALGQVHVLAAGDVESDSDLTDPVLAELPPDVDNLSADDVESGSDVIAPTLAQVHVLFAQDVESASDLTDPVLGQAHALAAGDVESDSDITDPALGQAHALAAGDVESGSDLTDPELIEIPGVPDALSAEDVESGSEVTVPALGQVHNLGAEDVQSATILTFPVINRKKKGSSSGGPGARRRKRERDLAERLRREKERREAIEKRHTVSDLAATPQAAPQATPQVAQAVKVVEVDEAALLEAEAQKLEQEQELIAVMMMIASL